MWINRRLLVTVAFQFTPKRLMHQLHNNNKNNNRRKAQCVCYKGCANITFLFFFTLIFFSVMIQLIPFVHEKWTQWHCLLINYARNIFDRIVYNGYFYVKFNSTTSFPVVIDAHFFSLSLPFIKYSL
jgi:hypothetical protein